MWPFDQNQHQVYQQYAQAYDTGNFNGFDPMQAINHLRQFIQGAPPEMQQNIYQQHFDQMPYEQRAMLAQQMPPQYGVDPGNSWSMAQGLMRMGQEQPHLLQQIFSHPLLMGSAVALTALVAKHMLAQRQQQGGYQQQPYYNDNFQQQGGFQQQPYGYQQPYGNDQYQQQPYGNQQGYQNQPYYGNQQGYQDPQYAQQELQQERQREQELRRELRQEEQEIERLEGNGYGNQQRHHHRREEY
ncbi:hypothetical protein [Dictyobacter aurantiacus]|uniref:Alpha box domain-containing protein n=1 Tax=Dictyobacter aurantiacus TaxID=1936993 RepID=A0A401ZAX8_9CHLR|nr:hypothetical protein [Dictyobacter aurantiacus]GCE04015.1 hypothetical protein KDAU_13440 [Dictyobacter aurantiacus]